MKKVLMVAASAAFVMGTMSLAPMTAQAGAAWGKCKACHNFTEKKKVGPGLKGVMNRKAGAMEGMKYSKALASGDQEILSTLSSNS